MPISEKILLPTAYFPPISWFVFMIQGRDAFIEQMETFPKQTYRNRCEIMTAAGKAKLIVPITKPQGNHTLTRNIEICYREPWRDQHWKTLLSAYSSAPYFTYYADILQPHFESGETTLILHNQSILRTVYSLLGANPSVELTTDYIKLPPEESDYRKHFSPKSKLPLNDFLRYPQVFEHKYGFMPNLSILDLVFNVGPEAGRYLERLIQP
jgi:hypothetical protein